MSIDGDGFTSIQYQNANNSVRVTDDFMHAVENDEDWELIARTTGEPIREPVRSEEHTSELQSRQYLVCRLLLEKNNTLAQSSMLLSQAHIASLLDEYQSLLGLHTVEMPQSLPLTTGSVVGNMTLSCAAERG